MVTQSSSTTPSGKTIALGLRENWPQFTLLVLVNAFVGGMVGLERTILPALAEEAFGFAAHTAILSFIVVFGVTKAAANYFTGALADRLGRRRLLIAGWIIALPVPFLLIYAPSWVWVVAANALLGIHQGLCWSSTVVMKIDLVGERQRGLAMGLNEAAGYLAVGGVAFLTGLIATSYGLRPYPFYLGIALAVSGLLSSWWLVRDTRHHVAAEAGTSTVPLLDRLFWQTTWKHPRLGSITQAGLINNLNDGMVWGLLPMLLVAQGFTLQQVGLVGGLYLGIWGLGQIATGKMADHWSKKRLLIFGMLLQGLALVGFAVGGALSWYIALAVLLGIGTAVVYPTFLAAIADNTHPRQRAESIGVFRLWRDLGYAIGALLTGVLADLFGMEVSFLATAGLTVVSGLVVWVRMG